MSLRGPVVVAAIALAIAARPARADEIVRQQTMTFGELRGYLRVTTAANVLDAKAYERLDDGLASAVTILVALTPDGSQRVVAHIDLLHQIVYDLWDEVYTVITGPADGPRRKVQVKFKAEALKLLTTVDVALVRLDALDPAVRYRAQVLAALNPVSARDVAQVRSWLSEGGSLDRGSSFFGSFVSVFVNPKLPAADRIMRLTSQPYTPPRSDR
jgi:hypothetical protein